MDPNTRRKTITFRDLTEKKDLSVSEFGDYLIGLSASGDLVISASEEDMCMILLALTLHENGGCTLSSANNDFACLVNNSPDPLTSEIHLVDGTKLKIADKKLEFFDGPAAAPRRRKLPRTPDTVLGEPPPPKPIRSRSIEESLKPKGPDEGVNKEKDKEAPEVEEARWLENSWCLLELSDSEHSMFKGFDSPDQISILTASYFTKQLRMFTDASITAKLLDDIFKLFMDTIEFAKDTFMNYLSDISVALAKVPDKTHTRPMHGPAVKFLTELLKLCCEPVERVVLILDLLRTFSHFDNNLVTMLDCQTTAAVLGSMSANRQVIEVQRLGMDILSKIAKYHPTLDKKAPLREVGLDMIVLGIKHHNKDLPLARSACRVFANMASTLNTVLNLWLDTEDPKNSTVTSGVERYEQLLDYVFQQGIPVVQGIMKNFGSDLGVNTEGRRFIFFYSKLPQLQLKRTKWLKKAADDSEQSQQSQEDPTDDINEDNVDAVFNKRPLLLEADKVEEEPKSILKRVGSFENLRSGEKHIVFADSTAGGSDSETSSSEGVDRRVSPEGCTDPDGVSDVDDFSRQIVHHFVRKTVRRRSETAENSDLLESGSESDSEHEFLQSLSNRVKDNVEKHGDLSGGFMSDEPSYTEGSESNVVEQINLDTSCHRTKNDTTNSDSAEGCAGHDLPENNDQTDTSIDIKELEKSLSEDMKQAAIRDVTFLGKLVRTQIITYVGTLVFQGEDSKVLMVIDKPIQDLLADATAPPELIVFAGNQYGDKMTLMDLEPAIVISVIDAVRYRSVTQELVQSAVLNVMKSMSEGLLPATINTAMQFLKTLFADPHLQTVLADEQFVNDFRVGFQKATERMQDSPKIEDISMNLVSPKSAV